MAAGGSILVENDGGFVARFSVQYQEEGRTITSDSGNFTLGTSKAIRIPPGATDIFVKLEEEYFIDAWSTVCTFSFNNPVTKCYELSGTTLNAKCNEKPCPG